MALLTSALLLGAESDPAHAGASFEASIDPPVLSYPATRTLTYRLEIASDADGAKLSILPSSPLYAFRKSKGSPGTLIEGSPIIAAGPPTYSGAGEARVIYRGPVAVDYASRPSEARPGKFRTYASVCIRGYEGVFYRPFGVTLTLPPHSTGALSFPYRTGRVPPWRPGDYRLGFHVDSIAGLAPASISFRDAPELNAPALPLGRRRGVFIRMQVARHTPVQGDGMSVVMRGVTRPSLRRQRIAIRVAQRKTVPPWGYRAARNLKRLAKVRTDRNGRFKALLEADSATYYTVAAYYRHHGPRLASARSCPLLFYTG